MKSAGNAEDPCDVCGAPRMELRHAFPGYALTECARCGFVRYASRTLFDDIRSHYASEAYSRDPYFACCREDTSPSAVAFDLRSVADRLTHHMPQRGRLLDVGCGTGLFMHFCERNGWSATGLELNPILARYARTRFRLTVLETPLEEFARLPTSPFAAVSFLDVLEHLPRPRLALRSAARILSPTGILLISVPNAQALINSCAQLLHIIVRHRADPILTRLLPYPEHINYFSRSTLLRLLDETGFAAQEVCISTRSHEADALPLLIRWPTKSILSLGQLVRRGNKILVLARPESRAGAGDPPARHDLGPGSESAR